MGDSKEDGRVQKRKTLDVTMKSNCGAAAGKNNGSMISNSTPEASPSVKLAREAEGPLQEYPNPNELDRMKIKGPVSMWTKVTGIMDGPICWKCLKWGPFFRCENCDKYYHRECVYLKPGFPCPIFDKPPEDGCTANWGEVNLLKCSNCLVSEESRVRELRNESQSDLNHGLMLLTQLIKTENAGNLLENFPSDNLNDPTVNKIIAKASNNEYKTVEAYYGDFRMILYYIVKKYSYESEATMVAKSVISVVCREVSAMIACLECTIRRFNANGKVLNSKEFIYTSRLPCKKPHVVAWVKQGSNPYWPAKILAYEPVRKLLYIQYFRSAAGARELSFPNQDVDVKIYSQKYPGERLPEKKSLRSAKTDSEKYLGNQRSLFGETGVVIPQDAEVFDGNVDAAIKRMFPLYGANQSVQDVISMT